jgi:ATP-dependent Clp protease ATP-binding subunit ClpA
MKNLGIIKTRGNIIMPNENEYFLNEEMFCDYNVAFNVSKLTGSPPGYIGHENGGRLTNLVKNNPKAILCLGEIEKAHPKIFNTFLQIMDDGILTSSQGETFSFKDILIIMTSNTGVKNSTSKIGFSVNNKDKQTKTTKQSTFQTL